MSLNTGDEVVINGERFMVTETVSETVVRLLPAPWWRRAWWLVVLAWRWIVDRIWEGPWL